MGMRRRGSVAVVVVVVGIVAGGEGNWVLLLWCLLFRLVLVLVRDLVLAEGSLSWHCWEFELGRMKIIQSSTAEKRRHIISSHLILSYLTAGIN